MTKAPEADWLQPVTLYPVPASFKVNVSSASVTVNPPNVEPPPASRYDCTDPVGTNILCAATPLKGLSLVPFHQSGRIVGAEVDSYLIKLRLVQFLKAFPAIEVTLSGMIILLRLVQESKASGAIEVTLLGMLILVKLVQ